jgi:hypothetical protein
MKTQFFVCAVWILTVVFWLISGQDCDDDDREDIGHGFREIPVEPRRECVGEC